jgi:hypothetical protein
MITTLAYLGSQQKRAVPIVMCSIKMFLTK